MGLARKTLLWASRSEWLGRQFQRRSFSRRAARRFIPGEDLAAALAAAQSLKPHGITTLITLLGENVGTASAAQQVTQHYLAAMDQIKGKSLDCQISIKLTQLGLDLANQVCVQQLDSLITRAAELQTRVWVDMEGSGYVGRTMDLVLEAQRKHENIGLCLQAYLHQVEADLERVIAADMPVRLVKGAYKEPADIAIQRKREVDANYLKLATRVMDGLAAGEGGFPAFGTHDMDLVAQINQLAAAKGVARDGYEFEMLYGIGREHQLALAAAGYQMRVLISYGAAWFPWYMRRLAERPANVWFVVRNLFVR